MGVDKRKEKQRMITAKEQLKLDKKRARESSLLQETAVLTISSSSCSNSPDSPDEFEPEMPSTSKVPPRRKIKILNENLLSLLNVAKVSDSSTFSILIPAISNVGKDP